MTSTARLCPALTHLPRNALLELASRMTTASDGWKCEPASPPEDLLRTSSTSSNLLRCELPRDAEP